MLVGRILAAISLVGLHGCRPQQPMQTASAIYQLSGRVLTSDGRPTANAVVIVTNVATTDEVGLARTDSEGRFDVRSPVARVALTAATPRGWAFLPKLEIGLQQISIRLSSDCHLLRGRVALDDPPPAPRIDVLRIGRLGDDVGDMFGASVDSGHRFEACLPQAEYYLTFPPAFAERTILTAVPAPSPLVARSVSRRSLETPPQSALGVPTQTQAEFVADLPNSIRVLGLGETNHGTHEFTRERTRLAIALARRHQFTLLMIEAGYGEVLALDDYVQGGNVAIDNAIGAVGYWIWNTRTLRDSLDELREYNRTARPGQKITIQGIDMQSTAGAIANLLASVTTFSDADRKLLLRLAENKGAQWAELVPDDRMAIRRTLEQVATDRDAGSLGSLRNRTALSARSLLLRFKRLEEQEFWNQTRMRDEGMAQLAREILALAPEARATVWAHLSHVAREFVVGAPTMGHHLAATLGSRYQVYGLLTTGGAALARHARKELGVVAHTLPTPPPYSLESALLRGAPGSVSDVTYWTFGRAGPAGKRWLEGLHWVQFFGSMYPANNLPFHVLDLTTFDGAILFRKVTPSQPMASGNKATGP
jgi:erythromycin esterase